MPIRDLELYGESSKKNIIIGVNRGASGIDGIISSAAGFANGSNKLCTLLIGDLAFIHDINSLLTIKSLNVPMIIVLINNNGGGIFDFLNISKYEDIFEKYFVAPHNLSFKDLAKSFDLNYYSVFNNEDFVHCYKNSLKIAKINSKSSLIEVFTERKLNLQIRKKIKKEIIQMLEQ
jgi:2-succinyl-5-enolpyruvyl-6-hydroxy-3-cyclohexene-1-carboxylate synthase